MSFKSPYEAFIFEEYAFDSKTGLLTFHYSFDKKISFYERIYFDVPATYDQAVFERAVFLAFALAGISYYKCYPAKKFVFLNHDISPKQAHFFDTAYKNGLSQFIYENGLSPDDIGVFEATGKNKDATPSYDGSGTVVLQSGGKDSLLLASLLEEKGIGFTPWYLSQAANHPVILDSVHGTLVTPKREIDRTLLSNAQTNGALNGHVPVTFITLAYALIDAVLHGKNTVLAAIGREGEEPHAYLGNFAIRHQWSKTWEAEQLFAEYVDHFISPVLKAGSPLRGFSELKIAELFVTHAWVKYGHHFSSCNIANYKQGQTNDTLSWCGSCPKCANSFLLLSPFVEETELREIFNGNLFENPELVDIFKGLLGIDDVVKPFECVGEIDELRKAYWLAQNNGYPALPFEVPQSNFDMDALGPSQPWASQMIQ